MSHARDVTMEMAPGAWHLVWVRGWGRPSCGVPGSLCSPASLGAALWDLGSSRGPGTPLLGDSLLPLSRYPSPPPPPAAPGRRGSTGALGGVLLYVLLSQPGPEVLVPVPRKRVRGPPWRGQVRSPALSPLYLGWPHHPHLLRTSLGIEQLSTLDRGFSPTLAWLCLDWELARLPPPIPERGPARLPAAASTCSPAAPRLCLALPPCRQLCRPLGPQWWPQAVERPPSSAPATRHRSHLGLEPDPAGAREGTRAGAGSGQIPLHHGDHVSVTEARPICPVWGSSGRHLPA